MTEELENTIKNKEFDALTATEKSLLKEIAQTKEEFEGLKMIFNSFQHKEIMETSPHVKNKLDELFVSTYPAVEKESAWKRIGAFLWPALPLVRKPLIQFAVLGLLVVVAIYATQNYNENTQMAAYTPSELDLKVAEREQEEVLSETTVNLDARVKEVSLETTAVDAVKQKALDLNTVTGDDLMDEVQLLGRTEDQIKFDQLSEDLSSSETVSDISVAAPTRSEFTHPDLINQPIVAGNGYVENMKDAAAIVSVELFTPAAENNNAILDVLTPLF